MKKLGGKKPRPAGLFSRAAAWFAAHVLPGFLMASVPALETVVSRHSAPKVLDSKAFGLHFATTLRIRRERFQAQARQIELLGFDDAFQRTWLFFLASSEASFQTGLCDVHQYILARD
jgi:cyclopropane-fatty-acyl-phospholipid synthase